MSFQFIITKNELQRLLELAILTPYESSFLLVAQPQRENNYVHVDTLFIERGEKLHTTPTFGSHNKEFLKLRQEIEQQGKIFIEGHTHPQPLGESIHPYNCGWTIARTSELSDYRNARLNESEAGQEYLQERQKILEQILAEPDKNQRWKWSLPLKDINPQLGIANLSTFRGIDCYAEKFRRV